MSEKINILAIESSCDETAAAVLCDGMMLSNVISSQLQHGPYGGVIPELASRLHQQNIVRVVEEAINKSGVKKEELSAIAFTRGPGLMGALIVGTTFAKGFALGLNIPLIEVNHLQSHVLAHFLSANPPKFPFLCLTVSGGHTQLVHAKSFHRLEVIGETIDDAAGEAFDKAAKVLGLGYPGGPMIDKLAKSGDPKKFPFPKPRIEGLDFSFSGLKTSLLYFLRDHLKTDPEFIQKNLNDICASFQNSIVRFLMLKTKQAIELTGVNEVAIAGGVSANSSLRKEFSDLCVKMDVVSHIPPFEFCTDNAAMIGIAGYYKFKAGMFCEHDAVPFSRENLLPVAE